MSLVSDVKDNLLSIWARRIIAHAGARSQLSYDLTTAALLEDEIVRRGMERAYTRALLLAVTPAIEPVAPDVYGAVLDDIWRVVRATPEQRARAFLKVVSE